MSVQPGGAAPEFLTCGEAARRKGCTTKYIYDLLTAGRLPGAEKVGKKWRIPATSAFFSRNLEHNLSLTEEDRQLVILALASLAVQRPGFDYALSQIALRIDNRTPDGKAEMYERFKTTVEA